MKEAASNIPWVANRTTVIAVEKREELHDGVRQIFEERVVLLMLNVLVKLVMKNKPITGTIHLVALHVSAKQVIFETSLNQFVVF